MPAVCKGEVRSFYLHYQFLLFKTKVKYGIFIVEECKIKAVQMARLLFTQVCDAQTCISSARSHFVANVRKKLIES